MSEGTAPNMPSKTTLRLISIACVLGLLGIAVSIVHFISPTALTFALFMLVGQGSFGAALLVYAFAVLRDLRRRKVL